MRKLLLGTTALAAAATISANAALADVSISGSYEFKYLSRSSNDTTVDGTSFAHGDSEMIVNFSSKTDSGLTLGYRYDFTAVSSDAMAHTADENSLSISGGFGKIVLGVDDDAADSYNIDEMDLIAEEPTAGTTNSSIRRNSATASSDAMKVAYHMPAMGGLTAGAAFTDGGEEGNADTTEFGAGYSMEAAGASVYLSYVTGSTENSTQDIDSSAIGVKIATGDVTFVIGQSQYEAENDDEQGTSAAVKFNVNDGLTLAAYTGEVEDDISGEEYSNSGAELIYTIASGLKAIVTIEDYDYKKGTGSGAGLVDDSGTHSKLTMKATF